MSDERVERLEAFLESETWAVNRTLDEVERLQARVAALTAALRRISYESQLSSWCAFCRGSARVADAALDAAAGGA
jgi:hypothetical protein